MAAGLDERLEGVPRARKRRARRAVQGHGVGPPALGNRRQRRGHARGGVDCRGHDQPATLQADLEGGAAQAVRQAKGRFGQALAQQVEKLSIREIRGPGRRDKAHKNKEDRARADGGQAHAAQARPVAQQEKRRAPQERAQQMQQARGERRHEIKAQPLARRDRPVPGHGRRGETPVRHGRPGLHQGLRVLLRQLPHRPGGGIGGGRGHLHRPGLSLQCGGRRRGGHGRIFLHRQAGQRRGGRRHDLRRDGPAQLPGQKRNRNDDQTDQGGRENQHGKAPHAGMAGEAAGIGRQAQQGQPAQHEHPHARGRVRLVPGEQKKKAERQTGRPPAQGKGGHGQDQGQKDVEQRPWRKQAAAHGVGPCGGKKRPARSQVERGRHMREFPVEAAGRQRRAGVGIAGERGKGQARSAQFHAPRGPVLAEQQHGLVPAVRDDPAEFARRGHGKREAGAVLARKRVVDA